jgi:sugar (pentulose or hexulose) kinase
MAELLVGVDVGTSSCKAEVLTVDGRELALGKVPTPWRRVPTGAEIEPGELVEIAVESIRRALAQVEGGTVLGIGVTSMAETGVLLDRAGRPITAAIAWHDARGEEAARAAAAELGRDRFEGMTGLPLTSMCSLAKYRHLRLAEPSAAAGARWLSVAEWVVRSLGGEEVAELSLASRTGFFLPAENRWWDEALAWAGAPSGLFPEAAPAGIPAGRAGGFLPQARGAILAVAGHDHLCASVGAGAVRPGDLFDSCGSAEAMVRAVEAPLDATAVRAAIGRGANVGRHVLSGRMALLSGFPGGLGLLRFLRLLGVSESRLDEIDEAALAIALPELPFVSGVEEDLATLGGIGWNPSPGSVWRAAVEELVRRDAEMMAVLDDLAGRHTRIIASGGWCRSRGLMTVKRRVLGELGVPALREAGCRGAALVAACAAGLYPALDAVPEPEAARPPAAS